ncbi:hypothetical protein QZQ97_17655 [Serratia sp. root2]|uniref:hypothetical protein n=1 Tax=Serratia sp. root2 TaxID=3059676 RepID=UPI002890AE91|nr:hypothetical protein [Serratia sp. root2]MDT3252745.1 hypothetical protein [Serratia sp. root2]
MWHLARLGFPDELQAVTCSLLTVHPWTYGAAQVTESGPYLSPQNAINYLAEKLRGAGGIQDVIVFLLTSYALPDFKASLDSMAGVFPLPVFMQTARKSAAALQLDTTKMQLPGVMGGGLPASMPLSIGTCRTAINAQRLATAAAQASQGTSLEGIENALNALSSLRQQASQAAADALAELQGKSVQVWTYQAHGEPANIAADIVNGVPVPDAIYTMGAMFTGDLEGLKGMIT